MTDNEYFFANFRNEVVNLGNGSATPTTGGYINDIWKQYYTYIRRCNRFLEHAGTAYFTKETERQRMIADVKVWRAWYHIQLLLWYGRNDGIPIVEKALVATEIYQPRNTVQECLDFINKELDEVISITDDEVCPFLWDEGNRARMSRSSALTLKMDVNLQFKQYELAKEAAKKLIGSGSFELYYSTATDKDPGKNFRDLFRYVGQQNKERILFTTKGLNENWFRCMGTPLGGQGTCAVLESLVDEFETADGVIGKTGASRSGYMMKKFLDERDRATGRGSLDYVLYRYAEVLLDYVECLIETGDWQNPDVEMYINMIRRRAGMPNMDRTVYNTQEKVRELYRRERRVELAFEGKRYHDIRRWGIGDKAMAGSIYGAWNPSSNSFVTIESRNCAFPKNDSWPLPQAEVTSNQNIKQPTGW